MFYKFQIFSSSTHYNILNLACSQHNDVLIQYLVISSGFHVLTVYGGTKLSFEVHYKRFDNSVGDNCLHVPARYLFFVGEFALLEPFAELNDAMLWSDGVMDDGKVADFVVCAEKESTFA